MKIYAPVKDANGVYASVRFVNGVGETDNPRLIEWFRTHGYKVPLEDDAPNVVIEPQNDQIKVENEEDEADVADELMGYTEKTPNFEDMTPIELRDWAKANGFGNKIKNTRNKEKLIEILRG